MEQQGRSQNEDEEVTLICEPLQTHTVDETNHQPYDGQFWEEMPDEMPSSQSSQKRTLDGSESQQISSTSAKNSTDACEDLFHEV